MPQKIDKTEIFSYAKKTFPAIAGFLTDLQIAIESVIYSLNPKKTVDRKIMVTGHDTGYQITSDKLDNRADLRYALTMWKDRLRARRRKKGFRNLRKPGLSGTFYFVSKFVFFGIIAAFIGGVAVLSYIAYDLPDPEKIIRKEGFSTKILDRNGEVLYDIYQNQKRIPVKFDDVPQYLKEATIAIEDKNFYKHEGFDILGIVRGFTRIFTRGRAQGGSTLTQQLVKNVLLTSERSVLRKVKEFVLAVQIERKYSKDEILLMYLNEAPYGGTSWGVESASESYFDKNTTDLNLVESAILAGLPQSLHIIPLIRVTPKAIREEPRMS
jgi:hypothetical protein